MTKSPAYLAIVLLTALALFTGACGATSNTEHIIQTSVAQTVEAQGLLVVGSPLPLFTETPVQLAPPTLLPTLPPPQATSTKGPVTDGELACMKATLVEETVPDGTILKPGEKFTKIWRIQNASTCVWDTSYKIVFWDGDLLGGAYVYNFPQQALPGDIVDVPLVLSAPAEDGDYQGFWKLQTPQGSSFGVGYDSPFWVDVIVSSSDKVEYGVTAVTYEVARRPETGCPANVFYTIYATITVNGPVTVIYNWAKSDGTTEDKRTLKYTEAGSKTVSMEWSLHIGSATNERWVRIFTVAPISQEYGKAPFLYDCK